MKGVSPSEGFKRASPSEGRTSRGLEGGLKSFQGEEDFEGLEGDLKGASRGLEGDFKGASPSEGFKGA